nr:hypothetical protein [Tanacetum cinerariifolium]
MTYKSSIDDKISFDKATHGMLNLQILSSHCQKKFPLLVRKVPPAEDKRCHCQEDCTAIEERVKEVYVEALQVKHPIIDWEVLIEGQRSYWKIIRLGGSSASYQFFVDLLKHLDRDDLNQLWALVKETLNIRLAINDKKKELSVELKRLYEPNVEDLLWTHTQNLIHASVEWKLYNTYGVHHVISKD